MGGDSMIHMGEVREMKRITEEYWNSMTGESVATFDTNADVLELIDDTPQSRYLMTARGTLATVPTSGANIGFRGGRFRLK